VQTEAFEYLTDVYPDNELQRRLDELGSVGWELITAKWEEFTFGGRTHNQARCILKRRMHPERDIFADPESENDEFALTLKALSKS